MEVKRERNEPRGRGASSWECDRRGNERAKSQTKKG